jgi:RNA polymerase sigma factor (sigma-70 family)
MNQIGIPTRRSLLSRLRSWDDSEGWQEFFDTYWKLIYGIALKAGLTDAAAQDVVQETLVTVARQMPHFKYDPAVGSFKSWLFRIAHRRIVDHLRQEYRRVRTVNPATRGTSGTSPLDTVPDPLGLQLETLWDAEWKQHLLKTALKRVKRQVDARHFQVFDCHVLKEWLVADVARTFSISPNQVYLIKHRVSRLLADELRRLGRHPV